MLFFLSAEGPFDPLAVHYGFSFWSTVTFVILLAILYKVGWGPLIRTIEEREDKVRGDIDAAEKARAEAEASMAKHQAQLDQAAEETKRLLDEARQAAERAKENILTEAAALADGLKAKAERDIDAARSKALADIKSQVVEIALAISGKVIEKPAGREDHERLADEVLAKAGDLRK